MGNKKISVCAYTDGKTEAYEIREDSKLLWHREFPIGQGLSDFLYVESFNSNVYSMLDKSPVFAVMVQKSEIPEYVADADSATGHTTDISTNNINKADTKVNDSLGIFHTSHINNLRETQLWLKDIFPLEAIPENLSYGRVCYEQVRFGYTGPFKYDSIGRKLYLEQHPTKEQLTEPFYTEVLHTDSAKDLISFMLVNYIKHGIRFRQCKYCGKYFGIVGNYNTEYCTREVLQAGGKTCKDLGSLRIYEKRLMESPVVREYKRSYKAHNARVSKGMMTRDEFNAWSVEAREKRDMCLRGEYDFEEFVEWLDSDRMRARR